MESNERTAQTRLFLGRVLCLLALGLVLSGAYFVSVAAEFLALFMGMIGYYLGARRLGVVIAVLAVAAAFVGLWWGAEYVPMLGTD